MNPRIEIFPQMMSQARPTASWHTDRPSGDWYWRLVGGNGETLCVSEAYTRKASARRGAIRAFGLIYDLAVQGRTDTWNDVIRVVTS